MSLKVQAAAAVKEGYKKGNLLEDQLLQYLKDNAPQALKGLQESNELHDYLAVTVNNALDKMYRLIDEGQNPMTARWDAIREMMPPPENDENESPEN
tara:strand:- start:39 stop:329 length:291 start_codon:yes stop_codon:yes gene_type:complete